ENGEEVECDRRDEPRSFASDIAPGHDPGLPSEHRQGPPDLPFEIEQACYEVLQEASDRAVDMRLLSADMAIGARQPRSAIEAGFLVSMPGIGLARPRLDYSRQQPAGHRIADCVEIAHRTPLPSILCSLVPPC